MPQHEASSPQWIGECWDVHKAEELMLALWCSFAHPQSAVSAASCIPSRSLWLSPLSPPDRVPRAPQGGDRILGEALTEHSEGALGAAPVLITSTCPQCPSETHWANWDQGTLGLRGLNAGGGDEYNGRIS